MDKEAKKITFDIDYKIYKQMKIFCANNDIKMKDFINNAIKEKLEK